MEVVEAIGVVTVQAEEAMMAAEMVLMAVNVATGMATVEAVMMKVA